MQAPPVAPSVPPPPPMAPYPMQPPQRQTNVALVVVLVVVGIVIVLVLGLIVAFVILSPIVPNVPTQPPTMALNAVPAGAATWSVDVLVDRSAALGLFSVSLTNETAGTTCVAQTILTPSFSATCSTGVVLSFTDVAGPGQLTTGDRFELTSVVGANSYTLRITWNATQAVIAAELIG